MDQFNTEIFATANLSHQPEAPFLEHIISPGLFEACDNNLYLIGTGAARKMAILLQEGQPPRMSDLKIDGRYWVCGNRWGPARAKLLRLATDCSAADQAGIITFDRKSVYLSCVDKNGRIVRAKIGMGREAYRSLSFDRWSFDGAALGQPQLRAARGSMPFKLHQNGEDRLYDVMCSQRHPLINQSSVRNASRVCDTAATFLLR